VVANWELVLRLRQRREELDLGIKDVADPLGFTRNYWSAIENERKPIPANTLIAVFDILNFDDREREELLELHEQTRVEGWWVRYSKFVDNEFQRFIGLEYAAHEIRNFGPLLIPGLLQTANYARAIMRPALSVSPIEVEQRVALRMHRQKRFNEDSRVELQALMCEGTLRQQIGGVETLKGQLDHLLQVIDQHPNNFDIRVIPFAAESCTLFGGGTLSLLGFLSPRLPQLAWMETVSTWGIIAETDRVRHVTLAFDEGRKRALDREETVKLITKIRKELR